VSRRSLIVIALIVIAAVVVVVAAVAGLFLLAPSGREIKLEMMEFSFNGTSGGPVIKAKVGETIKIVLTNKGVVVHEFMIVKDLEGFREALRKTVDMLREKGLDEEAITNSNELHLVHHAYIAVEPMVGWFREHHILLKSGESVTFTVTFDRPGTYYYVCASLSGTFPEPHINRGMYSTIIVEG
jgi:plastocyanin